MPASKRKPRRKDKPKRDYGRTADRPIPMELRRAREFALKAQIAKCLHCSVSSIWIN